MPLINLRSKRLLRHTKLELAFEALFAAIQGYWLHKTPQRNQAAAA